MALVLHYVMSKQKLELVKNKTKVLNMRLLQETHDELTEIAERNGTTISNVVRTIIDMFMKGKFK